MICKTLRSEESAFNKTLGRGIELFNREIKNLNEGDGFPDHSFKLYDTFGFPIDLTELLARENGFAVTKRFYWIWMRKKRCVRLTNLWTSW